MAFEPPRRRQGAFPPALGLESVGPSLVIDCIYVGFNAKTRNNNFRRHNTSRTFLSIQHTCNDRLLFSLPVLAPKVAEEPLWGGLESTSVWLLLPCLSAEKTLSSSMPRIIML